MPTPLEDYMADLIQQHKLHESIGDSQYDGEQAQSQAEEAQALYAVDAQDFDMLARSYNMTPAEWAGHEDQARKHLKAGISAQYAAQRAGTVANQARNKRDFTESFMTDLQRLNSVNQRGVMSIEQYAPRDPGLRTQLVFDPDTGQVTQQTKNVPDEAAVRTKELAQYLQLPEDVVMQQQAHEKAIANDALWKQHTRIKSLEDDVTQASDRTRRLGREDASDARATAAAQRAEEKNARMEDKAAHAAVVAKFADAKLLSTYSPEMVGSILNDPNTPPSFKVSAMMGDAMRRAKQSAQAETDEQKRIMRYKNTFLRTLENNPVYQTAITGGDAEQIKQLRLKIAEETGALLDEVGVETHKFDPLQHHEDFGIMGDDAMLSDIEAAGRQRSLSDIGDAEELRLLRARPRSRSRSLADQLQQYLR